jgi:hypothetical protein
MNYVKTVLYIKKNNRKNKEKYHFRSALGKIDGSNYLFRVSKN